MRSKIGRCRITTFRQNTDFNVGLTPDLHAKQRGFTLIELLVVVLIIGILAAVALPQYQKAVFKSQFQQWGVITRAAQQNTELFLLETGGFPGTRQYFTGENRIGNLDLAGDCDTDNFCYINGNTVNAYCESTECFISIFSDKLGFIAMHNSGSGYHVFDFRVRNNGSAKVACQWLHDSGEYTVDQYPKNVCEPYVKW